MVTPSAITASPRWMATQEAAGLAEAAVARLVRRAPPGGGYVGEMGDYKVSRSIVVDAPPATLFEILTDPRKHPVIDGSGSVQATVSGPERLSLGSRFGMRMRIGIPFFISNKVVEFETDRLIAWRHLGRHRWRYELDPVGDGATRVTETFDYSMAPGRLLLHVSPFPARNATGIEATLKRLKSLAETGDVPAA